MTLLLRVEAGPEVGLGHLRRSLSLADAMKKYDAEAHFLLHPDPRAVAVVERSGRSGELMNGAAAFGEEDVRETLAAAGKLKTRTVLLDYYDIPVDYVRKLREAGLKVMLRDDLALRALPVEVVVNGNADAEQLGYRAWVEGTRFMLGPRYAVLAKEYAAPSLRRTRPQVGRILLAFGGSDPRGRMPALLERLDRMPEDFEITVIQGPFFDNTREIQETASRLRKKVHLVSAPDSMAAWIAGADLSVSAAGQTLYELACFGCPAVAFQVAENQQGQLAALVEAGCLRNAGKAEDPELLNRIEELLSGLLRDARAREEMSQAGQRLIDGQGADRVARGILEEVLR